MNRISIALCTYNGAKFISEQLESIAQQDRIPDELIICDDCSTDNTVALIEDFARKVDFTVKLYINDTRLGVTKNYERAIGLCTGNYIALSDQDDVWDQEKLRFLEEKLNKRPEVAAVFSNADIVDESLHSMGYSLWDSLGLTANIQKNIVTSAAPNLLIMRGSFITGSTMAFRSSFKNLILPIPECWVHDGWISYLLSAVSYLDVINQSLIKYRQHNNNQIGAEKIGFFLRIERAKKRRNDMMLEKLLNRLDALKERLDCQAYYSLHNASSLFNVLQKKRNHIYTRVTLPKNKVLRIPAILRETVMLKYFKYSNGLNSIAQDLLLN